MTLLVFSGELDKLLAAFNLAVTAAACGMKVSVFFTFWGVTALKQRSNASDKSPLDKLFTWMIRPGFHARALSRFDFAGIGRRMLDAQMRRKQVCTLPELVERSAALGVRFYVCETSKELLGISDGELVAYPHMETCGAAQFLSLASSANTTLFV